MKLEDLSPGSIVQHKVSKEVGLILAVELACVNPRHTCSLVCNQSSLSDCDFQPVKVVLSVGLGRTIEVPPICLEKV